MDNSDEIRLLLDFPSVDATLEFIKDVRPDLIPIRLRQEWALFKPGSITPEEQRNLILESVHYDDPRVEGWIGPKPTRSFVVKAMSELFNKNVKTAAKDIHEIFEKAQKKETEQFLDKEREAWLRSGRCDCDSCKEGRRILSLQDQIQDENPV